MSVYLSKGDNGFILLAKLDIKCLRKLTFPRKDWCSFLVLGRGAAMMALALFLSTSIPHWWTKMPRKFLAVTPKVHFLGFIFRPWVPIHSNACRTCPTWSALVTDYVVNINLNRSADQVMEDEIHGSLVRCAGVLEAERHDHPFICPDSSWSSKCHFVDVTFGDKDLIVPGMAVHKGYELMLRSSIHQEVGHGHRVFVLWNRKIQVSIIYANPESSGFLQYWHNVSQPLNVQCNTDKAIFEKPFNFFLDLQLYLGREPPWWILKRFEPILDFQFMTRPDPNSTLESVSNPVCVQHLIGVRHKCSKYPSGPNLETTLGFDFY